MSQALWQTGVLTPGNGGDLKKDTDTIVGSNSLGARCTI